jgi:hypothetical protein
MTQDYGPVEFLTIGFDGVLPPEGVVEALGAVAEEGSVELLDVILASRGADGAIAVLELDELDESSGFSSIELAMAGITAEEDAMVIAESLEPGSSALIVAVELSWARGLANAIDDAGAVILAEQRIPAAAVREAAAAIAIAGN